jgi:hypothetical protein
MPRAIPNKISKRDRLRELNGMGDYHPMTKGDFREEVLSTTTLVNNTLALMGANLWDGEPDRDQTLRAQLERVAKADKFYDPKLPKPTLDEALMARRWVSSSMRENPRPMARVAEARRLAFAVRHSLDAVAEYPQ